MQLVKNLGNRDNQALIQAISPQQTNTEKSGDKDVIQRGARK
jgi:hypothetical protein